MAKVTYRQVVAAAKHHGESSEPEHEVGDLQELLALAYNIMDKGQRERFLSHPTCTELVEREG